MLVGKCVRLLQHIGKMSTDFVQYCEYYPEYEKCKQWLEKNLPVEFEKVKVGDGGTEVSADDEKKRQKRGGKGMMKAKKKDDGPKQVCVSRAPRGKKKSVTVVTGLSTFSKYRSFSKNVIGSSRDAKRFPFLCTSFQTESNVGKCPRYRPKGSGQVFRHEVCLRIVCYGRRRNRDPGRRQRRLVRYYPREVAGSNLITHVIFMSFTLRNFFPDR